MKNFFEIIFKRNIRSRNCSKSDTSVQNKTQYHFLLLTLYTVGRKKKGLIK